MECLDKTGLQILLVTDGTDRLTAVLTDGDIRRALLRNVQLDESVKTIANRNFVSMAEGDSRAAVEVILSSKLNHVPIVDSLGRLVDLVVYKPPVTREAPVRNLPVVIMAGGKGTRLSPLTRIMPKPLIPVGNETMLERIMNNFSKEGFHEFKVIVNYKRELVKAYFAETSHPYNVEFIDEHEYLGTAGGLQLLRGKIDGPFVLSNCDVLAEIDYSNLLDWHTELNAQLTILGVRKKIGIPHGVIRMDEDYLVASLDEKPQLDFLIMSGIYVLSPEVLDAIPSDFPIDMDELIHLVREFHMRVTCFPIETGWFDMGQFEEYRELLRHFEYREPH